MSKITTTAALAIAIALAGTIGWDALAQTAVQGGPGTAPMGVHGAGHRGMRGEQGDPAKRLAALKTELGITGAQEPAWNSYAKAVADSSAALRAQRMDRSKFRELSEQDRQTVVAQRREQREKTFGSIKAAAETLLPALDAAQTTKAKETLPGLAPRRSGSLHPVRMGDPAAQSAPQNR